MKADKRPLKHDDMRLIDNKKKMYGTKANRDILRANDNVVPIQKSNTNTKKEGDQHE